MFATTAEDYTPLDTYTFGWRWTSENHSAVPADERNAIRPLSNLKAAEAWEHAKSLQGLPYRKRFEETAELDIEARPESGTENYVLEWLLRNIPESTDSIYFSWSETKAVQTDHYTRNVVNLTTPIVLHSPTNIPT